MKLPPGVKLLRSLEGHQDSVLSVAFDRRGQTLASGSVDTVMLWKAASGKLLRTLEGHTGFIERVVFSPDGQLLASKSNDGTIRLWRCDTWETVSVIPEPTSVSWWIPALAFHPTLPLLATSGSPPNMPPMERYKDIHVLELDCEVLLGKGRGRGPPPRVEESIQHRTAKVILVDDTGVGKSGPAHPQTPTNPDLTPERAWSNMSPVTHSPINQKQITTQRLWQSQLGPKRPILISSPNRPRGWWTSTSAIIWARRTRCSCSSRSPSPASARRNCAMSAPA